MDSCNDCPKRAKCRALCAAMETKIPKMWDGHFWIAHEPDAADRVHQLLANREAVKTLLSGRGVLTLAQREIFDLYYNEGLSQQAIAERLGVRTKTVEEHLARAKARILRHLERESADDADV